MPGGGGGQRAPDPRGRGRPAPGGRRPGPHPGLDRRHDRRAPAGPDGWSEDGRGRPRVTAVSLPAVRAARPTLSKPTWFLLLVAASSVLYVVFAGDVVQPAVDDAP